MLMYTFMRIGIMCMVSLASYGGNHFLERSGTRWFFLEEYQSQNTSWEKRDYYLIPSGTMDTGEELTYRVFQWVCTKNKQSTVDLSALNNFILTFFLEDGQEVSSLHQKTYALTPDMCLRACFIPGNTEKNN